MLSAFRFSLLETKSCPIRSEGIVNCERLSENSRQCNPGFISSLMGDLLCKHLSFIIRLVMEEV